MNPKKQDSPLLGVLLLILGIVVLATQVFTTIATIFLLGLALIIGGALEIAHALFRKDREYTFSTTLGGLINLALGGIMIFFPALSAVTLTLLISAALIVLGIFRIATSFSPLIRNRGWSILMGLITLSLGVLVFAGWPASGLFIIGLFLGTQLLLSGITLTLIGTVPVVRIQRETGPEISFAHDVRKSRRKRRGSKYSF